MSLDLTGITGALSGVGNAIGNAFGYFRERMGFKNSPQIQTNVEAQRQQAAHNANAQAVAEELKQAGRNK